MFPIKILDAQDISEESIKHLIAVGSQQLDEIKDSVELIIKEVKERGDEALVDFSKKFDGVDLSIDEIKVNESEIEEAYAKVDKDLLEALRSAKKNLIKFHKAQLREPWDIKVQEGVKAGQIYRPIESVGLYVPGGKAIYPSTVLMTAAPAFVAGVEKIIICSPPQKNGNVAPEIIVAAKEFDIDQIFKVGGAQAIAAMAYGTKTVPNVLKVFGPGNKWVNVAKQLVSNIIAIDTPAGPSDILIIADKNANEDYVIVDFLSQIEHDPDNIGILISTSEDLIERFKKRFNIFFENTKRKEIIEQALNNCLIIKAEDLEQCAEISNLFAPEHLELLIDNPRSILQRIKNAGAIFLGENTPVPLGDYSAGTNHVLPTGGKAKQFSGLNVHEFLKIIDVLECQSEGLEELFKSASVIAEFEGLDEHKNAIKERLKKKR